MGLFVASPKLEEGEEIRWSSAANHAKRSWYAAGGRLIVTDLRVLFQPNRVDGVLWRRPWECPLDEVQRVASIDRDRTELLSGGARRRLGISTSGGVEVFVVNRLDEKVIELRGVFGGDRSASA